MDNRMHCLLIEFVHPKVVMLNSHMLTTKTIIAHAKFYLRIENGKSINILLRRYCRVTITLMRVQCTLHMYILNQFGY